MFYRILLLLALFALPLNNANAFGYTVTKTWNEVILSTTEGGPVSTTSSVNSIETVKDSKGNTVENTYSTTTEVITRTDTFKETNFPWEHRIYTDGVQNDSRMKPTVTTRTAVVTVSSTVKPKVLVSSKITILAPTVVAATTTPTTTTTTTTTTPAKLDFGNDQQYLGTPTQMVSSDPSYYRNLKETQKHNYLVKQEYALSRGWTGKDSTIMIIDTGINTTSSEFTGKIKYSYDATGGNSITDKQGHGSGVAGVAAAKLNGSGVYGIAPDADLAIYKVSNTTSIPMDRIRDGLVWAQDKSDIVVANISANTTYSTTYNKNMVNKGNGIFVSTDKTYGGNNYYNLEDPKIWGTALGKTEMVVTVAAGNSNLGYVQNPATFSTATDSDGNLLLGGRMLVVGSYDPSSGTQSGAKSGSVCKNFQNNTCLDQYKVSDFYIVAPGTAITTTSKTDALQTVSGTSEAAPAVAGAVAVVHQMWPYMKGADIVQVLLKTADKTIKNYDVNTMGQGLLDLDKATRPIGTLGISLTGRQGITKAITGGITLPKGTGSISTLSSITVVDEMSRDFTVDLTQAQRTTDLIPVSHLIHNAGSSWASKFVGGENNVNGMSLNSYSNQSGQWVTLGISSNMFNLDSKGNLKHQDLTHKLNYTRSQGSPWLSFNGMWGQVNATNTFEYSALYKPKNFYTQGGIMYSTTEFTQGLVNSITPITSAYGMAGWANNNINIYAGIKPYIVNGAVSLTTPSGVDVDGNMYYTKTTAQLQNQITGFVGLGLNEQVIDRWKNSHRLGLDAVVDQNSQYKVNAVWAMDF